MPGVAVETRRPVRRWRTCARGCWQKTCGRFPFTSVAHQFFTPTLFANFARLGHELAEEPLGVLARELGLPDAPPEPAPEDTPTAAGPDDAEAAARGPLI